MTFLTQEEYLLPVYQRRDGATIKPGYLVKRIKGDETIFVVKHITTRKDLARVSLLLVPHEVFIKAGEQLEKVCKIDDVCCVLGRLTEALVTMARDNMAIIAMSIASYPLHVQRQVGI